jgi:GNAT superfamily N-acetyltransferase
VTVSAAAGYKVERIDDLTARPEEELREYAEYLRSMERENLPEDPPTPVEVYFSRFANPPPYAERTDWLVRDGRGQIVGRGLLFATHQEENAHLREAWIDVRADDRRRGLGSRLFAEIVRGSGDGAETVLTFGTSDRIPAGEPFLRAVGAEKGLETHLNQLAIEDIDRDLVHEWASLAPDGYRLVWIDRDVPDELMANVIAAYDGMNLAPVGSVPMNPWVSTPERIREWDAARKKMGRERRLLLAIHDATGESAGFTETAFDARMPHKVQQMGTAVIPAHRGRDIGKWLKAVSLERVLAERPTVRFVRTGNADVNAPMLSINTRLGFKPFIATAWWKIQLADTKTYVESRGL